MLRKHFILIMNSFLYFFLKKKVLWEIAYVNVVNENMVVDVYQIPLHLSKNLISIYRSQTF